MCWESPFDKVAGLQTFEVTDVVVVFLMLTLNIFHTFSSVSIVDFEQVNISWDFYRTPPGDSI